MSPADCLRCLSVADLVLNKKTEYLLHLLHLGALLLNPNTTYQVCNTKLLYKLLIKASADGVT